jgi:glycosyltransferase involved in cell wall biosynthesis
MIEGPGPGAQRAPRILVISNLFPPAVQGGYELECATVVEHLRRHHSVLVLTSVRGSGLDPEAGVVRRLPFVGSGRVRSLLAPLDAIRAARTMRQVLASFQPTLVYVWNGAMIPQAALRIAETSGVRVAYRICEHWFGRVYRSDRFMRHLYPGERGLRGVWAGLMRIVNRLPVLRLDVSRRVPVAVCWNSESLRRLTDVPATAEILLERVVHPATKKGEALDGLRRAPAATPTVAFIGRVDEYKGTHVAYQALADLRDRHGIVARLVVAGFGDAGYRAHLRELAEELGITPSVEDRGPLDLDGLTDLLAEAHVVVVPSVWAEPAGLVCVEAALARVPVVASRVGGIPELLRDEQDALLVPPGDARACADALARTLREESATAARVQSAFQAVQRFRLPVYLERMDEFLDAAVAELPSKADGG